MNLWGLNGGLTNLFGRNNGGVGLSGALTPAMTGSSAGSVAGSSIGGGLNGKGTLPSPGGFSTDIKGVPLSNYDEDTPVTVMLDESGKGRSLLEDNSDTAARMRTSSAAIKNYKEGDSTTKVPYENVFRKGERLHAEEAARNEAMKRTMSALQSLTKKDEGSGSAPVVIYALRPYSGQLSFLGRR